MRDKGFSIYNDDRELVFNLTLTGYYLWQQFMECEYNVYNTAIKYIYNIVVFNLPKYLHHCYFSNVGMVWCR